MNESQVIQELRRDLNYTKHICLTGHTRIKSQEIDNTLNESQEIQELRRDLNITKQICLTGHTNRVYSLIELKSGKIASASADNTIKFWDLNTQKNILKLTGHTNRVYSLIE